LSYLDELSKNPQMSYHENLVSRGRAGRHRQTDRYDEATCHLPQVANAPNTWKLWSAVSCICIQTAATRYVLLPNILASTPL